LVKNKYRSIWTCLYSSKSDLRDISTKNIAKIPLEEMGRKAVNILINDINNKTEIVDKIGYKINLSKSNL
jgi:hypothetical protein